jgi:hypothetical protein
LSALAVFLDYPLLLELILPYPRPAVSVFGHPPAHGQATDEILIAVAEANNNTKTVANFISNLKITKLLRIFHKNIDNIY